MNPGTARTAVETPSVQPRLFENGAPDVFIERNSNPFHQILDFINLGADTTGGGAAAGGGGAAIAAGEGGAAADTSYIYIV